MTLNKSLLASALCMCMALPSYADIASNANSATCDNGTIGATEGNTNLEANWNANTITIDWYNGDTKITTNTCTYDGAVTIPATPTKAGYTFNGWRVRAAKQCWEISDSTECSAKSGCIATDAVLYPCRAAVASCDTLNQTDCFHSGTLDGACSFAGNSCYVMYSGGSN